jgi:hypothetical protein
MAQRGRVSERYALERFEIMATWYVVNSGSGLSSSTPVGLSSKLLAGTLVNDSVTPLAPYQAQGVVFWPSSDVNVAAAAAVAQKFMGRGADESVLNAIMMAAVGYSALQGNGAAGAGVTRLSFTYALAALQALTSGTAFTITTLASTARLLGAEIVVNTALAGNTSDTMTLQGGSDSAGSIIASTNIFAAAGTFAPPGSEAYQSRGGQAIKGTITGGSALSGLSAGNITVNLYVANTN